ncbi:MAG: TatD family hydrolase [Candidatus Odinarchaeota archaeon]
MYHDAHVHLTFNRMLSKLSYYRERWEQAGIKSLQVMSMNLAQSKLGFELHEQDTIFTGAGKHPWKVKLPLTVEEQDAYELLVRDSRCSIIGEVGLDYHWINKPERYPHQRDTFDFFISLALETGKPINVHCKGAEMDILAILRERGMDGNKVNIHWFSGPVEAMNKLVNLGCYFSIGPAVHYSKHRKTAELVPLEQLLTESDGDVRYRELDTRGEPAMIPQVVEKIAEIREVTIEELKLQLYDNAMSYLHV